MSESVLIAYVVLSVLVLIGLIFMSFKLLKISQKQYHAEKSLQRNSQDYQLHPKLKQQSATQHVKNQDTKTSASSLKTSSGKIHKTKK